MKKELEKNINDTFNELDNILFSFSDQQLNKTPSADAWTGGQVTDHIIKSLGGISRLLNGPTQEADRDPGEKIKALEDLFLNFTIKMKSPDFIIPGNGPFEKEHLLQTLEQLKTEMLDTLALDLSQLCTAAEFPTFGQLTRLEWLHFYLAHTQRHTQQLKNTFSTLKQNA